MTRTEREARQVHVDNTGAPLPAHAAGNRRGVLGAIAGGLVLAASGLLLPDWLADTEAREGALGGALGGRRGKNRRGRRRRRTHGDKKRKSRDKGPQSADIVPTHAEIYVLNMRSTPIQTRGWEDGDNRHWRVPAGWDWQAIEPVGASGFYHGRDFASDGEYVAVQIGTDRVVWFHFTWPWNPEAILYAGSWDENGLQGRDAILAGPARLAIGEAISTAGITATRNEDTNTHVRLRVTVT